MALQRIVALMVAAATISMAVGRVHEPAKLDLALETWAKHPTTRSVRTLIRVRPGMARQVAERLAWGSNTDGFEVAPDLLVAELSPGGLRAASFDAAVTNISLDARVRSFARSAYAAEICALSAQRVGLSPDAVAALIRS